MTARWRSGISITLTQVYLMSTFKIRSTSSQSSGYPVFLTRLGGSHSRPNPLLKLRDIYIYINSAYNGPLKDRASQPTSFVPWTELNDNPVSIETTVGQHVEIPSRCYFCRPELSQKISSYPNFSQCSVGTDLIHWLNIFPSRLISHNTR